MKYRKLPHGEEQISIIGMGISYIHESSENEIIDTVRFAIEQGVNYFDLAAAEAKPYACYGKALEGQREKVYLQMHFGALYDSGKYAWTCDYPTIRQAFEKQLKIPRTDYTDMGFIHCIDEAADLQKTLSGGTWDYMQGLKQDGVIRHLGLSTHNPEIARRLLDTGLIDMMMFSINPAYDYSTGQYAMGSVSDRGQLYRECEKAGVGISVMKPFGGGQLLNAKTSPFHQALTKNQCIQYALDRSAVLTVLPGYRNRQDLEEVLTYLDASEEERDYSVIGQFAPASAEGICVYCNHCQPCPKGLNVGLINKYYDLAMAGDEMAKMHYENLALHAGDCIRCGHCESRCPFHVKQESRMEEIARYFGK